MTPLQVASSEPPPVHIQKQLLPGWHTFHVVQASPGLIYFIFLMDCVWMFLEMVRGEHECWKDHTLVHAPIQTLEAGNVWMWINSIQRETSIWVSVRFLSRNLIRTLKLVKFDCIYNLILMPNVIFFFQRSSGGEHEKITWKFPSRHVLKHIKTLLSLIFSLTCFSHIEKFLKTLKMGWKSIYSFSVRPVRVSFTGERAASIKMASVSD